jgi:fructokinase
MFYRHPSADMLYSPDEVDAEYILGAKLFHFGSITLITEPSRSATRRALQIARQGNMLISYDPNLRINLWPDEKSAKSGMMSVWLEAHIIKVSEEEIRLLSGETDIVVGAKSLWHQNLRLLVVTRGSKGCTFITPDLLGDVPGYSVDSVDTTGAGDGFVAGLIYGLLGNQDRWYDEGNLFSVCRFANAVGALTTIERGAIPALPSKQQVLEFLQTQ